ncbi:hypothetical protein LTR91_002619 [Friedmanniomyces endolithicus]|uniref:C2H2-type domain-containing protein n=1 Tax=Friedmanniomyces endolithicus TaxID=329885 RepID=A0AAN6L0V0_9PEZI|nr:hypothetical protein LTR57_009685 [Friedmanniomyces endolithicus]KAK0963428.1 hypothetical protein LTS01_019306 [Friedmanniomyces endolithicus]KAK1010223.1 hypothetical protein LTR91_002619 [Friedmanniomyces endolithicus]KAK1047881.1 hypothetical protein LTS16_004727 [Friedmanniomyces endolithicus]
MYEDTLAERTMEPGTTRTPPMQPMHRYLMEHGRPLFTSGIFHQDPTMQSLPDVPSHSQRYITVDGSMYQLQRYPSPSYSGFPTSRTSSSVEERDPSPWSSPDIRPATYSPETVYTETGLQFSGGFGSFHDHLDHGPAHCVTMHDVQPYADTQLEPVIYADEPVIYGSYAHEGYQPMPDCAHNVIHQPDATETNDNTARVEAAPPTRRRGTQSTRSPTSPRSPTKIMKRPSPAKRSSSSSQSADDRTTNPSKTTSLPRAFPCPFAQYGCASTFGSKNEWKRHVCTQHLRLGYWRCDQCPNGDRRPNDFNRKDLFVQHVRRMHPVSAEAKKAAAAVSKSRPARVGGGGGNRGGYKDDGDELVLDTMRMRCYREMRKAPARSGCLFCDQVFAGANSWDERMEHIGRHLEAAKKDGEDGESVDPSTWLVDEITEGWLLKEGLARREKCGLKLV